MKHPTTAPDGWRIIALIYPGAPGEIAVALAERDAMRMMALRWCEGDAKATCWQKGAHDWFVIPFTFAAAISRSLLQMKGAGFSGFDEAGLEKLIAWMAEDQGIDDCLCY